jgi:predicted nicotinamide N-methyase
MNPKTASGRLSVLPTDLLGSAVPAAEDLFAVIASRYDATPLHVEVCGEPFDLLLVRDTNVLLERVGPDQFSTDERLPYWADLWTSSIDLAGWVLEEQGVAGRSVLELGAGVGLAGIAAARAGAKVTLTDYETDSLLFARYNALRNLPVDVCQRRVRCVPMDWRAPTIRGQFDLIIGADIVYERRNFDPILTLLQSYLAPGGRALLTEPDRAIGQAFLAAAREYPLLLDHSYSSVARDGKTFRISRLTIQHDKARTP